MQRWFSTACLLLGAAGVMTAADSPFTGTWKFNEQKSKLTGSSVTYEKTASGEIKYKDYPATGPTRFHPGHQKDRPRLVRDDREGSGKTLTEKGRPTAVNAPFTVVYDRQ